MAADEEQAKADAPGGERRGGRDRRRQPVTIDLKAEPVGNAPDRPQTEASPSPSASATGPGQSGAAPPKRDLPPRAPPVPPPGGRSDGWVRLAAAGSAGGVVGLVLMIALQAIGVVPAPGVSASRQAIERAEVATSEVSGLDRRLTAVEAMTEDLPSLRTGLDGIDARLATLTEDAQGLAARTDLETIRTELADLQESFRQGAPTVSEADVAALAARIGRLEAVPPNDAADGGIAAAALLARVGDLEAALTAFGARIATLEQNVADIESATRTGDDRLVAETVAMASLRRAAAASAPFVADLDLLAAVDPTVPQIAALREFAVAGIASRDDLAVAFPAVADAIRAAMQGADPNAGFLMRLVNGVGGLVSIRPTGPIGGDDPRAVLSRIEAAAGQGDLETALAERANLPASAQEASATWAAAAESRIAVDRLIGELALSLVPGGGG